MVMQLPVTLNISTNDCQSRNSGCAYWRPTLHSKYSQNKAKIKSKYFSHYKLHDFNISSFFYFIFWISNFLLFNAAEFETINSRQNLFRLLSACCSRLTMSHFSCTRLSEIHPHLIFHNPITLFVHHFWWFRTSGLWCRVGGWVMDEWITLKGQAVRDVCLRNGNH